MNTQDIYVEKKENFHWRKALRKFVYEQGGKKRLHDNLLWNKMMYFLTCVAIGEKKV